MAGTTATLDPIFVNNVTNLSTTSGSIGNAASGTTQRVWQTPPANGWSGNTADIAGLVKPFDRSQLVAKYANVIADGSDPGTVADLIALSTQIQYVAAMERGYRARIASPIRCLITSLGRRIGHGDPAGIFVGSVQGYVQDVITSGQSKAGGG